MSGYPLPPRRTEPFPSEEEIRQEIETIAGRDDFKTAGLIPEFKDVTDRFFAISKWKLRKKAENPSAFFSDYPPDDYHVYLTSSLWRKIRKRVIASQNGVCLRCRAEAEHVHHRSYAPEVMLGLDDTQLVGLCRRCHELVEFDDVGKRRSREEQESILAERPKRPEAGDLIAIKGRSGFAERIRNLRQSYGRSIAKPNLSQTDFASLLNVPIDLLRSWERGGQMPHVNQLATLRRLTGVDINKLIVDEKESISTNQAIEVIGKNTIERHSKIPSQPSLLLFIEGGARKDKTEEKDKRPKNKAGNHNIEWHYALIFNKESQQYEIWRDVFFNSDTKAHDFSCARKMNINNRTLYKEKRVWGDWDRYRADVPKYISVREWESYL